MEHDAGSLLGGRYELRARVGKGGVGEVWEALDTKSDALVAIKLLRSLHRSNPEVRERFEREARLLARIESPRVCRLLDFAVDGEMPYLVTERLQGVSLDRLLRGGRALPLSEVAPLVLQIFDALVDTHAVGIVHRDLKPSNVFVEGEGSARQAKLIDFGISKLLPVGEGPLTSATATLGSPQYMAPEQLGNARGADERCDIYSAATIAFRALTGRLPFPQSDATALLALKKTYDASTLAETTEHSWPASLQRFFDITLARDPEQRPRTATQARIGWQRACRDAEGERLEPTPAPDASDGEGEDGDDGETPILSRRGARS